MPDELPLQVTPSETFRQDLRSLGIPEHHLNTIVLAVKFQLERNPSYAGGTMGVVLLAPIVERDGRILVRRPRVAFERAGDATRAETLLRRLAEHTRRQKVYRW